MKLLQSKMKRQLEILKQNKNLFEFLGFLDGNNPPSFLKRLFHYSFVVSQICLLVPTLVFGITHFSDISEATEGFYAACTLSATFIRTIYLKIKKKEVVQLIDDLQRNVDQSKWSNGVMRVILRKISCRVWNKPGVLQSGRTKM